MLVVGVRLTLTSALDGGRYPKGRESGGGAVDTLLLVKVDTAEVVQMRRSQWSRDV